MAKDLPKTGMDHRNHCRAKTLLPLMVLSAIACNAAYSAEKHAARPHAVNPVEAFYENHDPESGNRPQVYPAARLSDLFPAAAQIGFAVAIVPDPRVPRYRRLYDLDIVAIELGMLKDGYILDRFYLPWKEEKASEKSTTETKDGAGDTTTESSNAEEGTSKPVDRHRYGLMIFRCDEWRYTASPAQSSIDGEYHPSCGSNGSNGTRLRALYVLTDTATRGIEAGAFLCAIDRIDSQLGTSATHFKQCWKWSENGMPATSAPASSTPPSLVPELLAYPNECSRMPVGATLLVLGPNFSGGVDSMREAVERLKRPAFGQLKFVKSICLLSSSASDETNMKVSQDDDFPLGYQSLALGNDVKLSHIAHLLRPLLRGEPPGKFIDRDNAKDAEDAEDAEDAREVAILAEASTFGYGVCRKFATASETPTDPVKILCENAQVLYFPSNIADIRYGLKEQTDEQRRQNPLNAKLPSDHLPLDLGAENGSEYPESRQSGLTSVSGQLALDAVIGQLRRSRPRIIIVVATDVRDRLFLMDQLRGRVPRALLIDLEADNLIAHPDFLHASRGSLSVASAQMTTGSKTYGCEKGDEDTHKEDRSPRSPVSSWSTDYQAILANAVSYLYDAGDVLARSPPCIVTQEAMTATLHMTTLQGLARVSRSFPGLSGDRPNDDRLRTLGVVEDVAPLVCVLAACLWIFPPILSHRRHEILHLPVVAFADTTLRSVIVLYAGGLLLVTGLLRTNDPENSLIVWIALTLIVGVPSFWTCIGSLWHANRTAPPRSYRNIVWPSILAIWAVLLAATPLWQRLSLSAEEQYVDVMALERIALDPSRGMAFLLLIAIATLALLYASIVLATTGAVVNRNSSVLRATQTPAGATAPVLAYKGDLRGTIRVNPFGLLLISSLVIAAIMTTDFISDDVRLTMFGLFASRVALLAMTATTFAAALLACCSAGMAYRIAAVSRYLSAGSVLLPDGTRHANPGSAPGRWPADPTMPRVFPPTPAAARMADGGPATKRLLWAEDLKEWTQLLAQWLLGGGDSAAHRAALFALLSSEISLFRWCALGAVLCAFSSVAAVYLFPIEADQLLIFDLLLLVAIGVVAGYAATAFERDPLLSKVLCNRPAPRKFSLMLFMFIALPFLALALALAVTHVPGVVDWGGGLLQLLGALGVHP